jgi:hypothetical protein
LALLLTLILISCRGRSAAPEAHAFRIETGEDGVPTAVTSMVPKYEGLLMTYAEEVRLHQDEGRPESLLHRAYQYERGPDGYYYVMDQGNSRIAVFGPDGEFVRSFGRAGEGPGEFQSPMLQSIDEKGVILYDSRARRVIHFNLGGELLGTCSYQKASGTTVRMTLDGDHLVLLSIQFERRPDRSQDTWYLMTVVTTAGDTVGSVTSGRSFQPASIRVEGSRFISPQLHYGPMPILTHQPGFGILAEDGSKPEFTLHDLHGQPLKKFRMEMEARPVTEADREVVLADYRARLEEEPDEASKRSIRLEMEHTLFPDRMPYYLSVGIDRFGYFWVYPPVDLYISTPPSPQRVRLLSPEGEYLGDVEMPPGIAGASHPYLCTRREDPETGDYDYIVYRLTPAVPGFSYP